MLDPVRRAVLIDMAYELGGAGLAAFVKFLAAVRAEKWATAAAEIKNSQLYQQVPRREQENMMILTLGEFPVGVTSARDLVKKHEGLTLTAKPDAKGMWAIGYGHDIVAPSVRGVTEIIWTLDQAEGHFDTDYALAEKCAENDLGSEYWG